MILLTVFLDCVFLVILTFRCSTEICLFILIICCIVLPLILYAIMASLNWDDLREIFSGCQRMAKVPNAVEILAKITIA